MSARIVGLKELQDKLKRMPAEIREEIGAKIQDAAGKWVKQAKRDAPGDTGFLRTEISAAKVGELSWEVVSGSSYAGYVEFGTRSRVQIPAGLEEVANEVKARSGQTSVGAKEAIYEWCRRKGIEENLWWPIFISLMTKGMKPHPYFFKQRATIEPELIKNVEQILKSICD